jgi:hypothetical protein
VENMKLIIELTNVKPDTLLRLSWDLWRFEDDEDLIGIHKEFYTILREDD